MPEALFRRHAVGARPRRGVESPSPRHGEDRQFEPGRGRNQAGSGAGHGGPGHVVSPPASKADGRREPVWEFDSPALRRTRRTLPALEAIRMVEEPGLNPGRPSGLRAFETAPLPRFTLST